MPRIAAKLGRRVVDPRCGCGRSPEISRFSDHDHQLCESCSARMARTAPRKQKLSRQRTDRLKRDLKALGERAAAERQAALDAGLPPEAASDPLAIGAR